MSWLNEETYQRIKREVDGWPEWKKKVYDVDGSQARARSREYNESVEPQKVAGWFVC